MSRLVQKFLELRDPQNVEHSFQVIGNEHEPSICTGPVDPFFGDGRDRVKEDALTWGGLQYHGLV